MRVPAHIRFTLAELIALGLQSADVLARANSAIHLVLTEQQEGLPSSGAQDECSIISVEDADGITVAVTKHPRGETWDRRVKAPGEVNSVEEGMAALKGRRGYVIVDEYEPVVPRREPPHAAPAGGDRFQRGVEAMLNILRRSLDSGALRRFDIEHNLSRAGYDNVIVDGEISLCGLAKAFLDAYQPQITISDQVRFGQAKRAMRLLLRKWRDEGNIEYLAGSLAAPPEEWADHIGDIISIEGTIDIDALAKAFWSVMKGDR